MNYNIYAYLIYLPFMFYITIVVGHRFHKNGKHFIDALFPNDLDWAHRINDLLLRGYYLLNLGYVALIVSFWDKLNSWTEVLISIADRSGIILLLLGAMHYANMLLIYLYARKKVKSINNTSNI